MSPPAGPQTGAVTARPLFFILVFALCLVLGLAWKWGPLQPWLDIQHGVAALRRFGDATGPLAAILGFAVACILVVPITFLMLVAVAAFGPLLGILYVLSGGAIGAAVSFCIGRYLGAAAIRRLAGRRLNDISARLGQRGILATFIMRLVPVAPFALFNLMVGVTHIRLPDFLIGSTLGLLPASLLIAVSVDAVLALVERQPAEAWLLVVGLGVALAVGLWAMRAAIKKLQRQPDTAADRE
ncbi:VTT domain-containing protein [Ferrovibrio sp. MS7]|uniref:TVP38/TMEM64 family protein n=1 Tax=Ferrovibrio plantarum TaxID=3119164 RepID=UPI0031367C38